MSARDRENARDFLAERLKKNSDRSTAQQLTGKREINSEDAHRIASKVAREADRKKGR